MAGKRFLDKKGTQRGFYSSLLTWVKVRAGRLLQRRRMGENWLKMRRKRLEDWKEEEEIHRKKRESTLNLRCVIEEHRL